jgi:hypothetical protein
MSSIILHRIKKYVYIYQSTSFWNKKQGIPDNKKIIIGKIDIFTGKPIFKQSFIDQIASEGKILPTISQTQIDKYLINPVKIDTTGKFENNSVNNVYKSDKQIYVDAFTFE